jgi:radical SAM superfamily enzyme YgiQ (UPF0313 family)
MKDLILFINAPSAFSAYSNTKVRAFRQVFPLLSFMSLSSVLKKKGFQTAVLDLGIVEKEPYEKLKAVLGNSKPGIVGITSTTPLFFEVAEISRTTREKLGPDVKIIYGGPHATALPEESLRNSDIDMVVRGEGEATISEIFEGKPLRDIRGLTYKESGKILSNPPREFIKDLDELPFPDISLYDIGDYHCSRLVSRGTPVLHMETSRGCPFNCSFCNKNIYGRLFRVKSAERVVDEMEYFLKSGAGELRIIDDQFATDINHAKEVCRLILKKGLKFPWNLANGVRVDRVDEEFLRLAKKAGCYQVGIGFESGDQASLDSIDKEISLEQSIKCMEMVKRAGLESVGFFILGLPADTEEGIRKTIRFAVDLMPEYAKTTIATPFPGTRLFSQYEKEGRIKSRDWSKYNIHQVADVYDHPNLSAESLRHYYNLFYRKFYFNPRFLFRRLAKGVRKGTLFRDLYYGGQTFLPKIFG